jgi:tetratricopeptide (TPR) repeat protein
MGVAFIGRYLADQRGGQFKALVGAVTTLAIFMVWPALANNYYLNDRSNNYLPLMAAQNMLNNCEENAILFTVGDNETFPLWAAHEVYGFRDDVRVVNTALLQGDWYIEQMKNIYDVPMSLTDEQIWTYPTEVAPGIVVNRPRKPFNDRPRREQPYLFPYRIGDRLVDVPEMVVDEIIIENQWKAPIYFTSMPPGNSPLNLRARLQEEGIHNRLMQDPQAGPNTERTWDQIMNKFTYQSLNDPKVTRNIGVNRDFMITIGVPTITLFQTLINQGDTARAIELAKKMIEVSPENWQFSNALATLTRYRGDAAKASAILRASREKLVEFAHYDPVNIYYQQDIGMIDVELGITESKPELIESGIAQMRQAYARKPNDMSMFRKLVSTYERLRQTDKVREVVDMYAQYKRNLSDPIVRQYLGRR